MTAHAQPHFRGETRAYESNSNFEILNKFEIRMSKIPKVAHLVVRIQD